MSDPDRILVLAPRGRDGELIRAMLSEHGMTAETFATVEAMAKRMDEQASCAIVTVEALGEVGRGPLHRVLKNQPPWSDFPIVVLTAPNQVVTTELGNITLLERPLTQNTLLVTVRSALRARRRQFQARAAIEQRDQFLAMLGHELRNPLGAIVMATDLIGMDADRSSVSKRLGILSRQAHHLSRLVDDLLDVARVTTGKVRLQREPLAIDDLVRTGIDAASESTRSREIAISVVATSGAIVDGDPVRLAQVINNLIGNAIKYSATARAIEIGTYLVDDGVELRVTDHGIGIEPDMLGRVFELFAQAEAGLERSEGGMGIGLTLVDRLVRLHGGSVEARSPGRGKGSEFIVHLPVVHTQPIAKVAHTNAARTGAPVSVVVVEDSADLRELSVALLEELGCSVSAAANGPDGLALVTRTSPEIAIIDIGLPGMNGFEVARAVRESHLEVVLVAVTGYGRKEDRDEAIAAGFDLHFPKPVQVKRLRELVDRVRADRLTA